MQLEPLWVVLGYSIGVIIVYLASFLWLRARGENDYVFLATIIAIVWPALLCSFLFFLPFIALKRGVNKIRGE